MKDNLARMGFRKPTDWFFIIMMTLLSLMTVLLAVQI